jgi:tetratricopeptide (TPR) repeat protein
VNYKQKIEQAEFLRRNGRLDECMRLCNEVLNEHIDCPEALFLIGHCLLDSGKYGLAHSVYMQFLRIKPNIGAGWNNLGRAYQENNALDESERCFKRALKIDHKDSIALSNIGLVHLNRCEPEESIKASLKALEISPEFIACRHNLGLAYLLNQQWKEGWENFEASVGHNADRRERVYGNETRWDGTKGKCVIAYGEQGLGDEISFASCVPDFIQDCSEAVIECDERLLGLFRRSFPEASIYGTRYKEVIDWADRHHLEGRISFGSLPKYYRNRKEDFPGTPYLVADPERRVQWRALLDSLGPKKKIGISWQGGLNRTGKMRRSVSLESLLPVLRQDAIFVSVQYKNAREDIQYIKEKFGIEIHHWPRAAEAHDYDETAALVAELDAVVSVTTSVIHLAGALGTPAIVLTPKQPRWFYGLQGESVPWYKSVELIRQKKAGDWLDPINEAAVRVRKYLNGGQRLDSDNARLACVA